MVSCRNVEFSFLKELEKSIPCLINSMLENNPDLEILKIKVYGPNIDFKINLPSENLKNLFVLEMDLPLFNCDKIHEQIPFKNNIVSLKTRIEYFVMKKSDFFEKLQYLTKYINGVQDQSQLSKCVRFRSVFVMMAWNLRRNLRKFFRKDIIEEIFLKFN